MRDNKGRFLSGNKINKNWFQVEDGNVKISAIEKIKPVAREATGWKFVILMESGRLYRSAPCETQEEAEELREFLLTL